MAFDKDTVTTQLTSKTLKAQLAISMFLFWFGGISWFFSDSGALDNSDGISWSAAMMIIGGIWYVITKLMIWWQHE